MKNKKLLVVTALMAGASLAGAQDTTASPIDFTEIATRGVAVIGAAGLAGGALMLAGNGLKIAVKWGKRLVGMS